MDSALEKILSNDPLLTKSDKEETDESIKRNVGYTLHKLSSAACDLYEDGELSWDEALSQLITSLGKLKGKEKELLKNAKKDYNEDKKSMSKLSY